MERVVFYCPEGTSLEHLLVLQNRIADLGIVVTECAVGRAWNEVLDGMSHGDELVVESLSCFLSLTKLLGFVAVSGVRVRSLSEEWFAQRPIVDPLAYQCKLYELASSLHAARTRQGLRVAAQKGHKPGRRSILSIKKNGRQTSAQELLQVKQVEVLRSEQGLSVIQACHYAGISVSMYYRYRKTNNL